MGCDIHAHIEIKVNGEWHYYAPADLWRNYLTFAKMASVRNDSSEPVEPIAQPRGLPEDSTFMTKMHNDRLGVDGHSHSRLSLDEIKQLVDWFDNELGYRPWGDRRKGDDLKQNEFGVWLFGNTFCNLKEYQDDYPEGLEDVRLVFWFDC